MTTLGSLCLLITLCLHSVSDSEDSESDDEPLAAKKNEPPSVSDPSPVTHLAPDRPSLPALCLTAKPQTAW